MWRFNKIICGKFYTKNYVYSGTFHKKGTGEVSVFSDFGYKFNSSPLAQVIKKYSNVSIDENFNFYVMIYGEKYNFYDQEFICHTEHNTMVDGLMKHITMFKTIDYRDKDVTTIKVK